jgi:hypothetical protein
VHCGLPVIGVTPPFVARVCRSAKPDRTFARRRVVPTRDRALFENESEERDEAALTGISTGRCRRASCAAPFRQPCAAPSTAYGASAARPGPRRQVGRG